MSEQNKTKNAASSRRKVNKKPSTAPSVIIAVAISLFVFMMVGIFLGGCSIIGAFFGVDNPNHNNGENYADYFTDEDGNKYYTSFDDEGNSITVEVKNKNLYNFLVIGKDRAAFNTDVIIIVSYDIDKGAVSMMQIPRDTYIEVPDSKGNVTGRKANALLALYYNQAKAKGMSYNEAVKTACDDMRDSISKIFGIPINHFVMLDLKGFVNIVDAIGGVELTVPQDMFYEDPEQNLYINLKAGYQTLDGNKSEQFIRFRKGYANADLGRVDAQKIFISAFIEKVQKSFSIETIVAIVNQLSKYVVTDIDMQQMIYFAKGALSVDTDNIAMLTMPGDVCGKYYVAYRDDTFDAINDGFNPFGSPLKKSIFDPDGSLYDTVGSRIYGVYSKTYSGYNNVPTYSAGDVGDIYIPQVHVTANVTESEELDSTEETDIDVTETSFVETTDDVHTETAETADETEPEETIAETTAETVTPSTEEETTDPVEEVVQTKTEVKENTDEPAETAEE